MNPDTGEVYEGEPRKEGDVALLPFILDSKVQDIYRRGADVLPPEYLLCNQSEPERVEKIKSQATDRQLRRNLKRLQAFHSTNAVVQT